MNKHIPGTNCIIVLFLIGFFSRKNEMFYVIEIIKNHAGNMYGPKTWEECQEIMREVLDGIENYTEQDILYGSFRNGDYSVEIIQTEDE